MYGALWRVLPGPWPVKLIITFVVIAVVLYGLVFYAFPWADALITPQNDVTVGLGLGADADAALTGTASAEGVPPESAG